MADSTCVECPELEVRSSRASLRFTPRSASLIPPRLFVCVTLAAVLGRPVASAGQCAASVGPSALPASNASDLVAGDRGWPAIEPGIADVDRSDRRALPRQGCAPDVTRVRVRIVDSVDLPDDTLHALAREVESIWSAAAVSVSGAKSTSLGVRNCDDLVTLYVLLRDRIPVAGTPARRASAGRRPRRSEALEDRDEPARPQATGPGAALIHGPVGLAWIPYTGDEPGRVIFVSVPRVRALLGTFDYGGRPVDRCTAVLLRALVGRALGRVVAHEVGHYFLGRAHAHTGLMKAMLDANDLLGQKPPGLAGTALAANSAASPF